MGDLRLGSDELKTGLCIVTKRVDTGSPWVLTNNPRAMYWYGTKELVPNKAYRLADVVRASAAAPYYFAPHRFQIAPDTREMPGRFVDGAISPFNNPALQMLMLAGLNGYGLDWPLGEDDLLIISVGTGTFRYRVSENKIAAWQAADTLKGIIGDGEVLTMTLMQWLGASQRQWRINSEIGDLAKDALRIKGEPVASLMRFERFDAPLEHAWLEEELGLKVTPAELEALRDICNSGNLPRLYEIGSKAARWQVQPHHLPDAFRIVATSS